MHTLINKSFMETCYKKEACLLSIAPSNFTSSECQEKAENSQMNEKKVHFYAQASCVDWSIYLPYSDYELDRDYLGLIVTVTDLVVLCVFLLGI